MKTILTIALMLVLGTASAQTELTKFIEIVGSSNLQGKLKIIVKTETNENLKILNEDGKPLKFESMVQAMGYFDEKGYEFVDSYTVKNGLGMLNSFHYLIKLRTE